jgi:hypothetical protein
MIETIRLRRGTAATWTADNPVLSSGEPGYETDTGKAKVGDGATAWNSLGYWSPGGAGSGGGSGTVTSVSVATANGFTGTVANPTTIPAVSVGTSVTGLLKGNGTVVSAATAGTDYLAPNGSGAALTGITAAQAGADAAGAAAAAQAAAVAASARLLTPTAVKTSGYTAAAGDFVPCDTTGGSFTVTLPTAPADLTAVGIKQVTQGGTNTVTVACGGSDVFNKAGGSASGTLALLAQGMLLQYKASLGVWYVMSDDLPLPQLDGRYPQRSNNLSDLASLTTANTNLGAPVNVIAYGAKGDGTTDDTTAIQNALNATRTGGRCVFPQPASFYLISAALQVPNGVSVLGPAVSRPGKSRTASTATPAVIKVANGANLNAVITDKVYLAGGTAPVAPSASILIRGLVIDGNSSNQAGGNGHGIILVTEGSSVEECGVQNVRGSGIVIADQNAAGNNTSSSLNQPENGVYRCNVYQPGVSGIVVQNNSGGLTDGYIMENIVDLNGAGTGVGIDVQTGGGWRVAYNHCYATPGDSFHLKTLSCAWIYGNYADNYGQAGTSATTYYGFLVTLSPFGGTEFTDNVSAPAEAVGSGAANFTHFSFACNASGQNNILTEHGSHARQRNTGSGTSTAWAYSAVGGGGTLAVFGKTSMGSTVGSTIIQQPSITGTVTFPDFRGAPQASQPSNPSGTLSATLVMAGFAIAFTPQATGKVKITVSGGAGVQTAVQNVTVGARYGTGTAPANGAAVTGTRIGVDQTARGPATTVAFNANWAITGEATGLTPGTAYWFDLAFDTGNAADQAQIGNVSLILEEVP